jgi:hypothetical protein
VAPERPMRLHPLAPDVKCPTCGSALAFVRVRGHRDLYRCASGGSCKGQVMHSSNTESKTCGYASVSGSGVFGRWTACAVTAGPRRVSND